MTMVVLLIHISIRTLIVIAGLMIEYNVMNLDTTQHASILWIGRMMMAFGSIRLLWLLYQFRFAKQQPEQEDINDEK